jgi:uncharacterized membrane protein
MVVSVPMGGFSGACDGYTKYKYLSLGGHVFGCVVNAYGGLVAGAFLGAVWPITGFVVVKRYLEEVPIKESIQEVEIDN